MINLVMIFSSMFLANAEVKAHVHGQAEVSIAFDKTRGKIILTSPTQAIYGFEYTPKTKKDKDRKTNGLKKLEESISKMIIFPESSNCEVKTEVIEVNDSGKHSDLTAEFNVSCATSPAGEKVVFKFSDEFKNLKKVKVEIMVDELQKSHVVTKSGEILELK